MMAYNVEDNYGTYNFPDLKICAKSGTAEVGDGGSPNAVFAGFAPLNNPQLLAVSIIENGASGTSAGLCVRDVFDEWFGK